MAGAMAGCFLKKRMDGQGGGMSDCMDTDPGEAHKQHAPVSQGDHEMQEPAYEPEKLSWNCRKKAPAP
jgi:hypothetical protein